MRDITLYKSLDLFVHIKLQSGFNSWNDPLLGGVYLCVNWRRRYWIESKCFYSVWRLLGQQSNVLTVEVVDCRDFQPVSRFGPVSSV